jgi:hypothetical protein
MIFTFVVYDAIYPKLKRINLVSFVLITVFGFNVFSSGLRAQVFTFFFLTVTIFLLKHFVKYKFLPLIFVIIFALWANLHGGFILGLFLIGSAFVESVFNRENKLAIFLGLNFVVSLLASLINPYGLQIFEEDIRHIKVPMGTLIAEWVAPRFFYMIIVFILTGILLYELWRRKNKNRVSWSTNLLGISYLTIKAKRNLPFFGLIATGVIYEVFENKLENLEKNSLIKTLTSIFLLSAIFLVAFVNVPKTFESVRDPEYICTQGLLPNPCKAVKFIRDNNIPGINVFSSYEWGGYLAWQLPQYKFFVDGRTPAWPTPEGKSPYTVYLEIIQAQKGYQESLAKYGTDWMLVPANTFLDIELQENKRFWKEIFRDEISAVYVKT